MSLWLPQIVMLADGADRHAGLFRQERRRRGSGPAASSQTSDRPEPSDECDRAIRQLVLQGLATVNTLTAGPAALLIAFPCPVKIGLLARIRSARDWPSFRGRPPTKTTQSAPSNACFRLVGRDRAAARAGTRNPRAPSSSTQRRQAPA